MVSILVLVVASVQIILTRPRAEPVGGTPPSPGRAIVGNASDVSDAG